MTIVLYALGGYVALGIVWSCGVIGLYGPFARDGVAVIAMAALPWIPIMRLFDCVRDALEGKGT